MGGGSSPKRGPDGRKFIGVFSSEARKVMEEVAGEDRWAVSQERRNLNH